VRRTTIGLYVLIAGGLLALGVWSIALGTEGLAYMREWPTMSDGSEAKVQIALGVLAIIGALLAGWRAVRAARRTARAD